MGPLTGCKIIEIRGIGPGPYAGMLLADLGADVIVVDRPGAQVQTGLPPDKDVHRRGKRSIFLDLKSQQGIDALLRLVSSVDVLFEGFRPGVAERLGFGPEACLAVNPTLVYGRVTGWGQSGPLAGAAGHDINYIAMTGVLAAIGSRDKPVPPLNLVGDYGGGSLFLVIGVLAALLEARTSGKGQVVDAAIVDGAASLMSVFHGWQNLGGWNLQRESNLLDGGAHFYNVYETSDGKYVSIGPLEPKFYALLVEKVGLSAEQSFTGGAAGEWPQRKSQLADVFRQKTQREWCDLLEGTDACFAPVLDINEAPRHPHHRERGTYISIDGIQQPAPAPRFSRTRSDPPKPPGKAGADTRAVLEAHGFSGEDIEELIRRA